MADYSRICRSQSGPNWSSIDPGMRPPYKASTLKRPPSSSARQYGGTLSQQFHQPVGRESASDFRSSLTQRSVILSEAYFSEVERPAPTFRISNRDHGCPIFGAALSRLRWESTNLTSTKAPIQTEGGGGFNPRKKSAELTAALAAEERSHSNFTSQSNANPLLIFALHSPKNLSS